MVLVSALQRKIPTDQPLINRFLPFIHVHRNQKQETEDVKPFFCHFLRFAKRGVCPSLTSPDSFDYPALQERLAYAAKRLVPPRRVKTLLETGEHSTYNVEIEDVDSRAQRNGRLHGLPLALGSVAVAFLTLIDSVKLDR
jgi:hypothetical protein